VFVQWFFPLCDNDNCFCFRLISQLFWLNGAFGSLYTIVQPCRFIVQSMQNHCASLCAIVQKSGAVVAESQFLGLLSGFYH
jgi:hypothetical protein